MLDRRLAVSLCLVLVALPCPARAEEDDAGGGLGAISLWEVSGITGGGESYENQLALLLEPSVKLGWLAPRAPRWLRPLKLAFELQLSVELAGNDARYHGAQFATPTIQAAGAEAIAINQAGMVADAASGQIEGTGRRALLSDLWMGISHPSLYTIPKLGVDLGARLAFTFPTSEPSRNAGLRVAISLGISLARTLWKRLDLAYGFRHVQYLYRGPTAEVAAMPDAMVEINGRLEPLYRPPLAVDLNPRFGFVNTFSATLKIVRRLSLFTSYSLTNTFTYALSPVAIEGQPAADPCADAQLLAARSGGRVVACGDRAQRDNHWFQLRLELELVSALSLSLGLSTLQPVRHEGNTISNPFLQTLPTANYTTIELGLSVDIEQSLSAARKLVRRMRAR